MNTRAEAIGESYMPENNVNSNWLLQELDRSIDNATDNDDAEARLVLSVLKLIYLEVKELNGNPMVKVGQFIRDNPKVTITLVIVIVFFLNAWFVSGFRQPLLAWLGIPIELVP